MPEGDLRTPAIPETVTPDAVRRRAGQHAFATAVAGVLKTQGFDVLDWWVGLGGGVSLQVRLGGGAIRTLQFNAPPAQQPTIQTLVLARLALLEAHVDG